MKQMDDDWMRPRTKAGTEEMRKRLKAMKELLKSAASQSIESEIASKVFNEYFSFDWDNDRRWEEAETSTKSVDTAPEE
tara:strand:+ start:75 stop:311 length:237 start_codon:yes stop_codon:yes gene_type:complete